MGSSIRIVEVGPRDGLQNETAPVAVEVRAELIRRLVGAGTGSIEVGSFVSPRRIPQMAGTAELLRQLSPVDGVRYSVLVPNLEGMEAAVEAGVKEIAVFASASETFSQRNINCSIAASIDRFRPVMEMAAARFIPVRGYVSCVLGCPYEGPVSVEAAVAVAKQLVELGCYEISLGDTIGIGTPGQAREVVRAASADVGLDRIAVHFHDTRGQALANILACLEAGVRTVDSSVAGLGGCPYAPGASGNVSTEDLVFMLDGLGMTTGVNLRRAVEAGLYISRLLRRPSQSKVAQAMLASGEIEMNL